MLRRQPALDLDEDNDENLSSSFSDPFNKSAHSSNLNDVESRETTEIDLLNSKNSLNRIELVTKSECRRAEKVTDLTETDEGISRVLSYHETVVQKQVITFRDSSDVSDSESVSDENPSLADDNFLDKIVLEDASSTEPQRNDDICLMEEEEDNVRNKDIRDNNFIEEHEYCSDLRHCNKNSYSIARNSTPEPNAVPRERQKSNPQELSLFKKFLCASNTSFCIQSAIVAVISVLLFFAEAFREPQTENSLRLPERSKDAFLLALPTLKSKFPNQSDHLWMSMAAALQMVDANDDHKVAVVLFSASEKAEPTAACIAKAVAKSISLSSVLEISIDFKLSNFNKPILDSKISEILSNSNSIILRHIELLKFPTLLYKFCDAESAFLDKRFFFLTLASSVPASQCQTCVENFLRKAWVPSGKLQSLEIIEPLFSRIANCVVFVEAEKNIAPC